MSYILEGEYQCPECQVISIGKNWALCEPYCEDCGSHLGVVCPACNECIDTVWNDGFDKLVIEVI